MGVASLVLGIVSLIISIIPFCGVFGFIPAVVGLGLAIPELITKSDKGEPKGMGIAGLVLNIVAIVILLLWIIIAGAITHYSFS